MMNSNYRITNAKTKPVSQKVTSIDINEEVDYDNIVINGVKIIGGDGVDLNETPYIWQSESGPDCILTDAEEVEDVTKVVLRDATFTNLYLDSGDNYIILVYMRKLDDGTYEVEPMRFRTLYMSLTPREPDYQGYYIDDNNPFPYAGQG